MIQTRLGFSGVPRQAWVLLAGNTLDNLGLGLFFPILPLFVESRGGGPALVGIIGASALIGNLLTQQPGGWLADRYNRRRIVIASMAAYGVFFLVYLVPVPVDWLIGIRFVHAALGGFYIPAARALLADLTPVNMRATVYGHWQGSGMSGFLIGPIIGGGVAGQFGLKPVFIGSAIACLAGAVMLVSLPRAPRVAEAAPTSDGLPRQVPRRLLALLLPAILAGAAWSYMSGAYSAVWVLYMTALGGSPLVAGLSLTAYSLPVVLFSGAAGRLGDRFGIRTMVFYTLLFSAMAAVGYAFTRSIPLVIGLSFLEALFTIGGMPAVLAEISRVVPSHQQGRAQGLFSMLTIGVQAIGSLGSGLLFQQQITLPFIAVAGVCVAAMAAVPFLGRRPAVVAAEPA
ncbi:MAG TPA: MFS transporter [Candidatus Dormibacteraeota bacterium]